ncbi:unnamed protein product [Withania somnifera]
MATVSPFSLPFPFPNTSSKFHSPVFQPDLEQLEVQRHQLHPKNAAVEQVNDERLHGASIKTPESGVICNHSSINHSATAYHVMFNQDYSCFAIGTDRGFGVFNCVPFCESFCRYFENIGGGIGIIEMLFRSNILAFVGHGDHPQYPRNKVMIWDDHQSRCISELCFRSEVLSIRLRQDCIMVVLEQKISVYNFSNLKLLFQIETTTNPKGLCEVSKKAGPLILVCPGLQKGQVRLERYAPKRSKFIVAHDSVLACFALTREGNLLATASSKGTNPDFQHTRSYIVAGGVLPKYFSSEWSVAQFQLPGVSQYIVTFGNEKNTLIILGWDGSFFRCKFDPASGKEMTQLEYHNFLKPEEPW